MEDQPRRRKRLRLDEFDYTTPGPYFVTVCVHDRRCIFGRVHDQRMEPNALGRTVETCWWELREHYREIDLENFVVMPNHVQGIVVLKAPIRPEEKVHALPEIVRAFKTFSSRAINARWQREEPIWQRGFYDRIVRDEDELARIREYIDNNPVVWNLDRENPNLPDAVTPVETGLFTAQMPVARKQGRV